MRVNNSYGFNDMRRGTVGIMTGEDEYTGERKAYIGAVEGHNEELDRQSILDGGQKLPLSFLEGLVRWMKPQNKDKKKRG